MIKSHVVKFYEEFLSEKFPWRNGLSFESIDHASSSWLEIPFEVNGVFLVICWIVKDKASGLVGFSMTFYHDCWETVGEDVFKVFHEFILVENLKKILMHLLTLLIQRKLRVWR